ncbi:MAG: hypothetical protein RIB86_12345 [Imperialibacter sp.]
MNKISRRKVLTGSAMGIIGLSLPLTSHAASAFEAPSIAGKPHASYPSIEHELVSEVVGKSHSDLDRVKELVDQRPELARATIDWGFADFESAIGAASHVGRRDIVQYLLGKGARPNIFTYATLGAYEAVKSMIDYTPGIQTTYGPHGISLLAHASAGLRMEKTMTAQEVDNCKKLIDYLESLGNANGQKFEDIPDEKKPKYLGDYKYGQAKDEGFSVQLNMRKMLSLGVIGQFGGALYQTGDNEFIYNGAPSVKISFQFENNEIKSLTVKEPGQSIVAVKIS